MKKQFWQISTISLTILFVTLSACSSQIGNVTEFPFTQTINGTDVEFVGYERDGGNLRANLCYEGVGDEGWRVDDASLIIEGQELTVSSSTWSNAPSDRLDGFTCGSVSFPVGVSSNLGKLELIIGKLVTPIRGYYDCDKAQARLDRDHTGIVIFCTESTSSSSGFGVSKKPASMSFDEAFEIASDAFGEVVKGPWRFSFTVGTE